MKRILASISMLMVMLMACAQGISRLSLDTQALKPGMTVKVTYDAKGGTLGGQENLVGIAYTYDNYVWHIHDVDIKNIGDNVWSGNFTVPVDCGIVAFKFKNNGYSTYQSDYDLNDKQGFVYKVVNAKGKAMPGTEAGYAEMMAPQQAQQMLGNFGRFPTYFENNVMADDDLLALLHQEMKNFKGSERHFFEMIVNLNKKSGSEAGKKENQKLLEKLEKMNLTDYEMNRLSALYCYSLNDKKKAEEIIAAEKKKYPMGIIARNERLSEIQSKGDSVFLANAKRYAADFSITEWRKNPDSYGHIFTNFYRGWGRAIWNTRSDDQLPEMLRNVSVGMIANLFGHGPVLRLKWPDDPKTYVDVSKVYVDMMWNKINSADNMDGLLYTPKQAAWRATRDAHFYTTVFTVISRRAGLFQQAADYMEKIPADVRYTYNPQANEAYAYCLIQLGRSAEASKVLENAAKTGMMTPEMFKMLEEQYNDMAVKPAANYHLYLDMLKSPETKKKLQEEVKRGMVTDDFVPFCVKDIDGKVVNSANWKSDDVIVLDFWATWCSPCVAALSGMQMAVEKYLKDSHVKFWFVDTGDRATPEQLRKFFAGKGFHDMPIIIDPTAKGAKSKNSSLYSNMFPMASGIPQKAIIKNGKIRYRASGYAGSPSGLMDEISAVVELLKAEK